MTLSDFVGEFKAGGEALDAIVHLAAEAGPASARQALSRIAREHPELAARWLLLSALFTPGEGWDDTVRHGLDGHPEAALLLKALDRLHAPPHQEHVLSHLEQWLHKLAPNSSRPAPQADVEAPIPVAASTHALTEETTLPGASGGDEPGLAREEVQEEVQEEVIARLESFWRRVRGHAPVEELEAVGAAAEMTPLPEEDQSGAENRAPLPAARITGDTTGSVLAQLELLLHRVQGKGGQEQAAEPPRALTDLMRFHQALLRWEVRA